MPTSGVRVMSDPERGSLRVDCRRSMSICDSIAWTIQGQSTSLCKAAQLCIACYSTASTCRLFAIRQGPLSAHCCHTVTMTRYIRVRRVRYYEGLGAHNAGRPDYGARGPADHGGVGQTPDAVEDPTARTGSDGAGAGPSSALVSDPTGPYRLSR